MSESEKDVKRQSRWKEIQHIYFLVLKLGWYISIYPDKFEPHMTCFLLRNHDCTAKEVVRLP